MAKLEILIATGLGLGYSPVVSGTVGSLGGVALFWLLHLLPWPLYVVTILALFFLGVWAADKAEIIFQKKDPGLIVIDEIVGFLVSVFLIPWKWPWVVAAFLIFRIFDVIKPFPLRQAEKFSGGLGVMLDDLGAGVYTNLLLQVIRVWL